MGTLNGSESGRTRAPWMLLIAGIVITLLGIAVIILASVLSGGSTSVGTIIFIGPIPIIIGSGPDVALLALIAVILALVIAMMLLLMRKRLTVS